MNIGAWSLNGLQAGEWEVRRCWIKGTKLAVVLQNGARCKTVFEPYGLMSEESADATITRMLLAEPLDFAGARSFINHAGARTDLSLDLAQIDGLGTAALRKLTQRILAVCVFGPSLCSLMFSLTRLKDAERRAFSFVGDVFGNYISDEFPNTTREFLQTAFRTAGEKTALQALIKHLLKHIKGREKLYKDLPDLEELRPAREKLQAYRIAMMKEQREILEGAERQSIFASIFPKINLKYGRSVMSEIQGKFTDPTHLRQISHSIELPRSELRDPVAGILQRDAYLKAGK